MIDSEFKIKLNYVYQDTVSKYAEKTGIFTAVRLLNYAIQIAANGGKLNFSNSFLAETLNVPLSTLHYAIHILEAEGVLIRTWKDESIYKRDSFKLDYKVVLEWLKTTVYDKGYINAPKRSFKRAFIKQTLIYVRDDKNRIQDELTKLKINDDKLKGENRKMVIDSIKKNIDREYQRYVELKTKQVKRIIERNGSSSDDITIYDDVIVQFAKSLGYRPPSMNQSE